MKDNEGTKKKTLFFPLSFSDVLSVKARGKQGG